MINIKKGKRLSVYRNIVGKKNGKLNTMRCNVCFPISTYKVTKAIDTIDGTIGYFLEEDLESGTVKVQQNKAGAKMMIKYINTKSLFSETVRAVTTFECEGGYFIAESTDFECDNFLRERVVYQKSGHIGNNLNMRIISSDMAQLKSNGNNMVCRLYTGDYIWAELFCVSNAVATNYKTWDNLRHERLDLRQLNGYVDFLIGCEQGEVRFPFDFIDKHKIKKQSFLITTMMFNTMKIELEPVICDLTGRKIQRSKERAYTYTVSQGTKECLHILRDRMDPELSVADNMRMITDAITERGESFLDIMKDLHKAMTEINFNTLR